MVLGGFIRKADQESGEQDPENACPYLNVCTVRLSTALNPLSWPLTLSQFFVDLFRIQYIDKS